MFLIDLLLEIYDMLSQKPMHVTKSALALLFLGITTGKVWTDDLFMAYIPTEGISLRWTNVYSSWYLPLIVGTCGYATVHIQKVVTNSMPLYSISYHITQVSMFHQLTAVICVYLSPYDRRKPRLWYSPFFN